MAITLSINNKSFEIPEAGEDPGWGEETTSYLQEIATVLNSLLGVGDILETTFNVDNNISVDTEVVGLNFNPSTVRSATIDYSVYRTSTLNPDGNIETGVITVVYDNNAAIGEKWLMIQSRDASAGITFEIEDDGQFYYRTTDIDSAGYAGIMKFKARTLSQ